MRVRESGQPGEEDKRTLTKQPSCKLMECKLRLLQVLRELTARGETSCRVVQRPPCSASGLSSSSLGGAPRDKVPGVPANRREVGGSPACPGVPVSNLRPRGQESQVRDRGLHPQPRALGEHRGCYPRPLQHTRCTFSPAEGTHSSFTLLRRKLVFSWAWEIHLSP